MFSLLSLDHWETYAPNTDFQVSSSGQCSGSINIILGLYSALLNVSGDSEYILNVLLW